MSSQTALTPPGNTATADHDASRVLILGGDGYLGWPTALHLSRRGHQVGVVDSLCRRRYDVEMGVDSLVPIASLEQRLCAWTGLDRDSALSQRILPRSGHGSCTASSGASSSAPR